MPVAVFFVTFFGLLASGLPIFLVLGICAAALFAISSQPLIGTAQLIVDHLNSPTLMSLPLFVMAATFMRVGGVAQALVNLAVAWLGDFGGHSESLRSFRARSLPLSADRASQRRWLWERSYYPR